LELSGLFLKGSRETPYSHSRKPNWMELGSRFIDQFSVLARSPVYAYLDS